MELITIGEIKQHLRVDLDDTSQDAHLARLLDAAKDYAAQYIGRSIPWTDSEGAEVPVPASVKAAILLVVGDLYANREDTVIGTIVGRVGTVENLLHFYRTDMGI